MRDHKDNVFYYESGKKANPLEKNTVHAFVKTLSDSEDRLTSAFFDLCDAESGKGAASFEYRTEVSEDDTSPAGGEHRVLVGLSRTGGVKEGGGTGETSHIDARIRALDADGKPIASVFVEAKVGRADLREGQLSDYAEDFAITEREGELPCTKLPWSDVYRIFEKRQPKKTLEEARTVEGYLTREFTRWLLQKGMVRGTLGASEGGGDDGRKYRKRLLVGPPEPGADPVLSIWAFSRRDEQKDQSATMEVPQDTFAELFGDLDADTRRAVFLEGELGTLREWLETNQGITESDYENGGYTFARAAREGYDEPAGIMLRLTERGYFKINSYNVERSNGWVYHPPILADHEWEALFQGMAKKLTDDQQERFIHGFDLDVLWDAYLKRSD
jgi:hypothetical protein